MFGWCERSNEQDDNRRADSVSSPGISEQEASQGLNVTVGLKSKSNPAYHKGHWYSLGYYWGFLINGKEGATVYLQAGRTYTWDLTAVNALHPFYITDSDVGGGAGTQFTPPSYGKTIAFTPEKAGTLYYQCKNHDYMTGQIIIGN